MRACSNSICANGMSRGKGPVPGPTELGAGPGWFARPLGGWPWRRRVEFRGGLTCALSVRSAHVKITILVAMKWHNAQRLCYTTPTVCMGLGITNTVVVGRALAWPGLHCVFHMLAGRGEYSAHGSELSQPFKHPEVHMALHTIKANNDTQRRQ